MKEIKKSTSTVVKKESAQLLQKKLLKSLKLNPAEISAESEKNFCPQFQ